MRSGFFCSGLNSSSGGDGGGGVDQSLFGYHLIVVLQMTCTHYALPVSLSLSIPIEY